MNPRRAIMKKIHLLLFNSTYSIKKKKERNFVSYFNHILIMNYRIVRLKETIRCYYVGTSKLEIAHVISEANISQGTTMGSLTGEC